MSKKSLSGLLGGAGMFVLYTLVNPLTMWLTFATFVGYAVIYTIILKPRTPQNIVIGGLSGAMPPALGWAAVADSVPAEAWLLVLIIFIWTVIDYLRAHLARRLTLEELAEVAGLSPFHFLRSFQAQYHATPQQTLMALRLFEAKRLLAAGETPAQTALAAGLTDQAHLTRAFTRRYQAVP
ncbi:UbiA family prenyltransferase [Lactiplantibacillus plantarum]|uniref:UbiA family prenyltransferase n=1 Tax=Lactiplantibacillus plantarum TaxID=1590 RepID=UPI0040462374